MLRKLQLLLFSSITLTLYGQNPLLNFGDSAPQLKIQEWLKGTPIQSFETGKVYVVEFWATWCAPCRDAMPHLSKLARRYKQKTTFIGVDVYEEVNHTTLKQVKSFVDSMGDRMGYNIAVDDSTFMVENWLKASEEDRNGIPRTFIVNSDGRLAWAGHPSQLNKVLPKILNNKWDLREYKTKRNFERHLKTLDDSLGFELTRYKGNWDNPNIVDNGVLIEPYDIGKLDSIFFYIKNYLKDEPMLEYAPNTFYNTFFALLKTNSDTAYEYGKKVLEIHTNNYYDYDIYDILNAVEACSDKINLPSKIYDLCIQSYRKVFKDYYTLYKKTAYWYSREGNKRKAIKYQRKAIRALKKEKNFSENKLLEFENQLQEYKKMTI